MKELVKGESFTFFPRMTAPGSPWMTMYFVPPRCKPVGARWPGSAKSVMIPVISSGLNCIWRSRRSKKKSVKLAATVKDKVRAMAWTLRYSIISNQGQVQLQAIITSKSTRTFVSFHCHKGCVLCYP